jgi:hypothetical protein
MGKYDTHRESTTPFFLFPNAFFCGKASAFTSGPTSLMSFFLRSSNSE